MAIGASPSRYSDARLNSYDLFKLLAIVIMLIDHIGLYLLPDETWLRAIGRSAAPIWLFLAGYGRLNLKGELWLFAILVAAMQAVWLSEWLPANILVSIIIGRLALRNFAPIVEANPYTWLVFCLTFGLISEYLWDYGGFALLFMTLGYWRYHQHHRRNFIAILFITGICYLCWQAAIFNFEWPHIVLMCLVTTPVLAVFAYFTPHGLEINACSPAKKLLIWLSCRSLYVYAGHLALLIPLKSAYALSRLVCIFFQAHAICRFGLGGDVF